MRCNGAGVDVSPGGDGDDYLHPGLGNDALDGGSDRDFVTFFAQSGPVEANLSTGSATGEDVGTDTPAWLEGLQGTDHDDDLTGDDGNNLLWAGYGEDRISGLGRNDDLDGGADELDLSRPNNRHLAFGAGLHYCIGAHLVRLELRMLLSELTRRVRMVEQTGAAVPNHSIIDLDLESLPLKLYPG